MMFTISCWPTIIPLDFPTHDDHWIGFSGVKPKLLADFIRFQFRVNGQLRKYWTNIGDAHKYINKSITTIFGI